MARKNPITVAEICEALDSMDRESIGRVVMHGNDKLESMRSADLVATYAKWQEAAEQIGASVDEVFARGRQLAGVGVVRYRDPANPENTWTGRGRQPNWLVAALKAGSALESFLVTEAASKESTFEPAD